MAKKLSSVLGVDLGSRYIKVVELKTQGKEPMLNAIGSIDTPEGAIDHTGVFNPEAVGAALKQAIQAAGASVPNVIVSIAGQASVLVRTLEVPRMNATELKEHMQWEINRNIPFAESNVVSDYRPLADEDPNSANMDVVMAISPQSAIDTVVAAIKQAKRVPVAIDVEPLSAARSLTFGYGEEFEGQTVCFVDMGHKTTAINIYRNGKLLMPRQIPVGGEMVTRAIADATGVSLEEAEKIKIEQCEVPATAGLDTGFGGFDMGYGTPTLGGPADEFQSYNPFADTTAAAPMTTMPADPTDPNASTQAAAPYDPMAAYNYSNPAPADYDPNDPTSTAAPVYDPMAGAAPAPAAYDPMAGTGAVPAYDPMASGQPAYDPMAMPGSEPAPFDPMALPTDPAPMAPPVDGGYGALANATVDPEVERLYNIIAPVLEEFVAEVRRSVDYFRSRGGEINRVVLSGGGAKLKGLTEYLNRSLGLECDAYDAFRRLNLNSKKVATGHAEEVRQDFVVAVGNALHIFFD